MTSESTAEKPLPGRVEEGGTGDDQPENRSWLQRALHEARETLLTIAVFVPFWLVFSTFVYELRSIPSESMVPALQVGDRVAVAKFAYGYNRNSVPFGIGTWFLGDNLQNPRDGIWVRAPKRGDVVVFQHPHNPRVMIKRTIGLPGDRIQMKSGRLFINGELINRIPVRQLNYVSAEGRPTKATEYREQLPGEKNSHLIHEWSDSERLDNTPEFKVPPDHVFMMGDNRDNSEDSRAPSGHPERARQQLLYEELHRGEIDEPTGWTNLAGFETNDPAIGFVPLDQLIGRADTVLFTLYSCQASSEQRSMGYECAGGRLWRGL